MSTGTSECFIENFSTIPVFEETRDSCVGSFTGQVKWFNKSAGYGFITVVSSGCFKNRDVFVHYSAIRPLNCLYRTLVRGEYVNFDLDETCSSEDNQIQATNVTGIMGGALMCDMSQPIKETQGYKKVSNKMFHRYYNGPWPQHLQNRISGTDWQRRDS